MEQILNITQNKILEIPNDQNRINQQKKVQIKFNRNRTISSEDESENINK